MTINLKIIFGGVYLFIGFCIETSLGQVTCKSYTLVQLPGAMPTNGVTTQDTGRSACESSCVNYASGVCYGFTWSNNICTLNTQSADALYHNASSSVDYFNLIKAYSDCNAANTCSYVWSGVKNQHGSGASNANINILSDCIKSCQDSSSCAALDWNAVDKSCWTYTNAPTALLPLDSLYFFSKNCTTPPTTIPASTTTTTSARQSLTTLPSTPRLLSSSTSSSSTTTTTTTTTKPSSSSTSSSSSLKPSTLANQTSVSTTSTTVPTTTVSLCNGDKCNLGAECVGDKLNRTCVCVATCPSYYSPVCGSDSNTYTNDCKLYRTACMANKTINLVRRGTCESGPDDQSGDGGGAGGEFAHYPAAIKPAYIVLAGLGGGCLLLVLTAVIILCQYPLRGAETYSSSGTLVNGRGSGYASQDIKMESAGGGGGDGGDGGDGEGGGGGEENVEFNPYYNRSELGAPDFTKEENIM